MSPDTILGLILLVTFQYIVIFVIYLYLIILITFDETKYAEGQSLVFICEHCKKQFSIRIGKTKLKATRMEEVLDEQENSKDCGSVVVVEKCVRI